MSKSNKFIATSDRVGHWIEKHRKVVFSLIVGLVVIGGAFAAWKTYCSYREKQAQDSLYPYQARIEKIQAEVLKKDAEEKAKKKSEKDTLKESQDNQSKDSLTADFGSLPDEYLKEISKYKGAKAGLISAIQLAALFMDYDNYDKAYEVLNQVLVSTGTKGVFFGLVHMQMGTVLGALNKYEEAKKFYDKVLKDKESEFLHSEAVLKIGLAEEKLGNREQAKAQYERASQEFASSEAGKSAKAYLRLMELEKAKMNP
ncbi:MAG: tetratricopeptide repeat protein [Bdellovibrionales bacterium]|nr:tetratricopeptide repeat protein [Bdellovibrionales bacterium]